MYRPESTFTVSLGADCTTPYTGAVVYQPLWVVISVADDGSGLEVGTGHQRGSSGYCRYRYWGIQYQGSWSSLGTEILPGGSGGPTKQIYRYSCAPDLCWDFWIGGSKKDTVIWNFTAAHIDAGLESYDAAAIAPAHNLDSLNYRVGSTYSPWAGQDLSDVDAMMCGRWLADNRWRAGENATC